MQGLPQIGDILDNTYRIEKQIGTGGFGAVYLARQLSMDREVALKILVANAMDVEEMIHRFRREVMACRNLGHPNTIRIYDFRDRPDGVLYYTMEYVNGPTLKDVIKNEGPIAPRRVAYILKQICKSLAEAHSFGIIHRDLKPANIMLADIAGETDFVKVVDFGIAKIVDDGEDRDQLTNAGVLVGTLNYMSPEQIQGGEVGPQSDIYALGLIAIEMLMGRSVFEGTGRWEVLHRQISDDPVDIPEEILGSPLVEVLQKALHKQASERFARAEEMLAALNAIPTLSGEPLVDWIAEPDAPLSAPVSLPVIDSIPVESEPELPEAVRPLATPVYAQPPAVEEAPIPVPAPSVEAPPLATPVPEPAHTPIPAPRVTPTPEATPPLSEPVDAHAMTAALEPLRATVPSDPTPVPHAHTPAPAALAPTLAPQPEAAPSAQRPFVTPTFADDFEPTDTDAGPPPTNNKKLIALAGALVAFAAVAAVVAAVVIGGQEEPPAPVDEPTPVVTTPTEPVEEPAEEPPIEEQPEEPVEQPPAALKTIRLETGTVRAEVFDGETLIGTTPVRFPVGVEKTFTLRANGYEEATVTLSNQSDDTAIELTRIGGAAKPPSKTKSSDDGWVDVKTTPPKTPPKRKAPPKKKKEENAIPIF